MAGGDDDDACGGPPRCDGGGDGRSLQEHGGDGCYHLNGALYWSDGCCVGGGDGFDGDGGVQCDCWRCGGV